MRILGVLVAVVLLVSGCGSGSSSGHGGQLMVPRAALEAHLHTWALRNNLPPTPSCPGGIPIQPGHSFHCLLTGGGRGSVRVTVTIENARGYLTWEVG